ncbi:hypothetical protein K438DRAFT_1954095 [Mycena galopus ATCC 62051]|nr:hypothetical protein K438DRAFT_1954095 [Mycena galopus ATCC 62051]
MLVRGCFYCGCGEDAENASDLVFVSSFSVGPIGPLSVLLDQVLTRAATKSARFGVPDDVGPVGPLSVLLDQVLTRAATESARFGAPDDVGPVGPLSVLLDQVLTGAATKSARFGAPDDVGARAPSDHFSRPALARQTMFVCGGFYCVPRQITFCALAQDVGVRALLLRVRYVVRLETSTAAFSSELPAPLAAIVRHFATWILRRPSRTTSRAPDGVGSRAAIYSACFGLSDDVAESVLLMPSDDPVPRSAPHSPTPSASIRYS